MTESADETQAVDLSRYWRGLRRRWYVVVLVPLLAVLAAGAYLALVPAKYTSTTLVKVNVISDQPFNNSRSESGLIDSQTEVQVARSSKVLSEVAQGLDGEPSLGEVRHRTTVTPLADATVVRIEYSAPSVEEARAGADLVAETYLDYRASQASAKIAAVRGQLEDRRDALRDELVEVNKRLAAATAGSGAAVQAESDRQVLNIQLNSLLSQINLLSGIDTTGGTVISEAADTGVGVAPSRKVIIGSALAVGLLVGVLLALVINLLDRRILDEQSVQVAGGGEVLARLRSSHARIPLHGEDLDAVRSLRERLLVDIPRGGVLAVLDVTTGDRPADVGVNLALAFAETENPVSLVLPEHPEDALSALRHALDLRPTNQDPRVQVSGLSPRLNVIIPPHEEEQSDRASRQLAELLGSRSGQQAITIVSLPQSATRALRLAAGRLGHSVLFVVNERGTRTDSVRALVRDLQAVNGVVHGTVVLPRRRHLELDAPAVDASAGEPALKEQAAVSTPARSGT